MSASQNSGPRALQGKLNIDEVRLAAKSRLPKFIFDYLDGGADGEYTAAENLRSFNAMSLIQRVLVDVDEVDTSTTILGMPTSVPFLLSSTGASRFFHIDGELAVARAAAAENVIYGVSASAMTSMEDIAAVSEGPRFFQAYVFKDRSVTSEYVRRSKAAGYRAMVLTVDCATAGNRERDLRNQLAIPPKATPRILWQLLNAPSWTWQYLVNPKWRFPNVEAYVDESTKGNFGSIAMWFAEQLDRSFTWADAELLRKEWDGQFVIKGITSVADAQQAQAIGASAIVVSNHGGRQLDHAPPPLEVLPDIVAAVGDRMEVLVDSGFRRGTDIIKALALGANGVLVGKSYLYGLGAGGEAGVSRVIEILRSELERNMMLMGLRSIGEITADCIRWRDPRFR